MLANTITYIVGALLRPEKFAKDLCKIVKPMTDPERQYLPS